MQDSVSAASANDCRFDLVPRCWVCNADLFHRVEQAKMDLAIYEAQDPELAAYTGTSVWLRQCVACQFIQPESLPSLPNFFDRLYDTRWSPDWVEEQYTATYRDYIFGHVVDRLAKLTPSGSRMLLDVGAHVGRFVKFAAECGWNSEGIELNPRTAAFALQRTQRPIHQMNAHQLASTGRSYDAITLLDVLEHIPQPMDILKTLRELLMPGGWIAVKVPCGPSQLTKERIRSWFRPGSIPDVATNLVHVNHFSPRNLRLILERAGYSDVAITTGAPELPPKGDGLGLKNRLTRAFRLGVYRMAQAIPGGVHTPLAFNLQAFARRPI